MPKATSKQVSPFVGFLFGMLIGLSLSMSIGNVLKSSSSDGSAKEDIFQIVELKSLLPQLKERSDMSIAGSWDGLNSTIQSDESFIVSDKFVVVKASNWTVLYSTNPVVVSLYKSRVNKIKLKSTVNSFKFPLN